jgi:serine/threonine-protein kinase RsbT
MHTERKIYINNDLDIVMARMQAREIAKQMGFGTADQARISLATSELARVLAWDNGSPGEIVMSDAVKNGQRGVQVNCLVNLSQLRFRRETDNSNLAKEPSLKNYSLAGACQLVDESVVEELNNNYARITLIKWLR